MNLGCLFPVPTTGSCSSGWDATLVMVRVTQGRRRSPRTEGLTQAEVIPGVGGVVQGSQANIQLRPGVLSPGLGKQLSQEEVAPAHSQDSLTWLPDSHKTIFSFST